MLDSLNNLVTQYNNASKNRKVFFFCKKSKKIISILNLLLQQGLILGFYNSINNEYELCVFLKFCEKNPIIKKINVVSSSGGRKYFKMKKIKGDSQSMALFVISTNAGGFYLSSLNTHFKYNYSFFKGGEAVLKISL